MLLRSASYALFLFLLLPAKFIFGFSTDPRLIQLVPPHSRLVAGMSKSAAQGTSGSFLLITHENRIDLDDFYAIMGSDASRRIEALVLVTTAHRERSANKHSLLVSGQFDRDSIFRFAAAGASRRSYRNIPILVVPAFERERETFNEIRWLAIVDGHIAIFGSVESVQRELDRWIDRDVPDQMLLDRLHRIEGHDDSWCVLMARDPEHVAETVLGRLDPKLGEVARDAGLLGYGIRYGRKIEIAVVADPFPARDFNAPNNLQAAQSIAAFHFFSSPPSESASSHAVVKISRRRYEEWIQECTPRDSLLAAAPSR